ncbi:MAG: N-acetylmannosamine-6-phosphate 2-epimerase [Candidatus Marinimicrobia bacterium]|nr:N-acetylmannosamine-6-phosphate 2-epimerase [Candidatus Neomarinimicrobiota bacterium]
MNKADFFKTLYKGLIVSCQAEGKDPFNSPEGVALFARAAEIGGAAGIRSCGIDKTAEIIRQVSLPVIGLTKDTYPDGWVRITRYEVDVMKLFDLGCAMVAVDGGIRISGDLTGPAFIAKIKKKTGKLLLADISTVEEGLACEAAGADALSTTLSGYTPETAAKSRNGPDFDLLGILTKKTQLPVFAEGRITSPRQAVKALELGAHAVIVGSAITRPRVITSRFVKEMEQDH